MHTQFGGQKAKMPKTPYQQFEDENIMVWGCLLAYVNVTLHINEGRMNGQIYQDILDNNQLHLLGL